MSELTTLEDRLRRDLPRLADALVDSHESTSAPVAARRSPARNHDAELSPRSSSGRRRWPTVALTAAAAVAITGGVVAIRSVTDMGSDSPVAVDPDPASESADAPVEVAPTAAPESADAPVEADPTTAPERSAPFGTWSPMAEAPIGPRPYAVSAWTGTEAVFWAGSSLSRGFAYTDGAAYDPISDSWRTLVVPGWGHPGLTSAYLDGEIYALAKGGGSRFDPVDGTWVDLPLVDTMFLAATVATDDAIWGLGPAGANPTGQPDLAIARYDHAADRWVYGPVYESDETTGPIVQGLFQLDGPVLWTGSEIVVWNGAAGGVAFDPSSDTWRPLGPPGPPSGSVRDSTAVMTSAGLVAVVDVEDAEGSRVDFALMVDGEWAWVDTEIPVGDFQTVTVAGAGDWIVLFSATDAPVTVHMPSGTWRRHDAGPIAGVEAPNTVWTGDRLIVWGGVAESAASNTAAFDGATWTPPPT